MREGATLSTLLCRSITEWRRLLGLRQMGSWSGRGMSFLERKGQFNMRERDWTECHLLRTTKCMAVRNSSRLRQPSLVTSDNCQICLSS